MSEYEIYDILKSYNLDDNGFIATALFILKPEDLTKESIIKVFNENVAEILDRLNVVGFKHSLSNSAEFENIRKNGKILYRIGRLIKYENFRN